MNNIKQLLINAITDQDSRAIRRLLNDAVETGAVSADEAVKLGHLADVMYTGSYDVRKRAAASALALVK
ncbi:hypothetical protein SEA_YUUY_51 [Microbacterium phage YuuY]|nr:hypothetical protein SEA_YUUY_51 [Microbacterium phage YuuY]